MGDLLQYSNLKRLKDRRDILRKRWKLGLGNRDDLEKRGKELNQQIAKLELEEEYDEIEAIFKRTIPTDKTV